MCHCATVPLCCVQKCAMILHADVPLCCVQIRMCHPIVHADMCYPTATANRCVLPYILYADLCPIAMTRDSTLEGNIWCYPGKTLRLSMKMQHLWLLLGNVGNRELCLITNTPCMRRIENVLTWSTKLHEMRIVLRQEVVVLRQEDL